MYLFINKCLFENFGLINEGNIINLAVQLARLIILSLRKKNFCLDQSILQQHQAYQRQKLLNSLTKQSDFRRRYSNNGSKFVEDIKNIQSEEQYIGILRGITQFMVKSQIAIQTSKSISPDDLQKAKATQSLSSFCINQMLSAYPYLQTEFEQHFTKIVRWRIKYIEKQNKLFRDNPIYRRASLNQNKHQEQTFSQTDLNLQHVIVENKNFTIIQQLGQKIQPRNPNRQMKQQSNHFEFKKSNLLMLEKSSLTIQKNQNFNNLKLKKESNNAVLDVFKKYVVSSDSQDESTPFQYYSKKQSIQYANSMIQESNQEKQTERIKQISFHSLKNHKYSV